MSLFNKKNNQAGKKTELQLPITWITPIAEYYEISNMALEVEHVLIAGAAGCGKSTFLHSIMQAALARYSPATAKFILIDPKCMELMMYEDLPHTLRYTDTEQGALEALKYAHRIMDRRYVKMKELGTNIWPTKSGANIYVIIEELANLMTCPNKKEIKQLIQALLLKGWAAGIRLIMATRVPSKTILPAEIMLNISGRFALACESAAESILIIGESGAELLPDHGQCYFRYQRNVGLYEIPFVTKEEVMELVRYWQSDACRE